MFFEHASNIVLSSLYFHFCLLVGFWQYRYHYQEHAVRQFIATNQFIEFDMMRRLQIANPQAYLEARYVRLFFCESMHHTLRRLFSVWFGIMSSERQK
jgi:hypothetical protein